jgi:hypothetical protein
VKALTKGKEKKGGECSDKLGINKFEECIYVII